MGHSFFAKNPRTCYLLAIIIFMLIIIITFTLSGIARSKPTELIAYDVQVPPSWTTTLPLLKPIGKDFKKKIFDLNFQYKLQPDSCNGRNILGVIIVTSHYNNVETRSAMRRAFSQQDLEDLNLKRIFLLGESPESLYVSQASLLDEGRRFRDIVQGNFHEAYRNLTYKHIMGLKWATENCHMAKYIIKMDDDIVANFEKIVHFLNNTSLPTNLMAGYILKGMTPIREPANKWYVTKEEYPYSKYPSFVSGWLYVTTPKIASKLVLLSHYFDYFWIDDVYVTGILTRSLNVKLFDLKKYFTVHPEFLRCCINDVKKRLDCDILVGPNGGDNNLFYEFNKAVSVCGINKCDKRDKPINETCVAERKIHLNRGSGIIESYKLS